MKIKDIDGTIVDCESDSFISSISTSIKKAIHKFKQNGFKFRSEDDTFQVTMIWIWKNLPNYDRNKKCKLSSYIYILIRTGILSKDNYVSNKDPFDPMNRSYTEIWNCINKQKGYDAQVSDIIPDKRLCNCVRYTNEIKDFRSFLFSNELKRLKDSKAYTVLNMLIKYGGNKKLIAEKLNITSIRVNQLISKIKSFPEFQDFCYNN